MLRALQTLAATAPGTAAAARAAPVAVGRLFSSSGSEQQPSALEWLERFTNWERRGVPTAAGTNSDAGFDLVRSVGAPASHSVFCVLLQFCLHSRLYLMPLLPACHRAACTGC